MSYWTENFKNNNKSESIKNDTKTDVCIIGAGLTGLTTGYYLSQKGLKVTIVEQNKICSKTSGCTTGKITSQHGLFYDYLAKSFGLNYAKDYLEANELAIKNIKDIVDNEKIKCDLIKTSSYVFCDKKSDINLFTQEIGTLNEIKNEINNQDINYKNKFKLNGLSLDCQFKKKLDISIKNFGGIEFENQAMFYRCYRLG